MKPIYSLLSFLLVFCGSVVAKMPTELDKQIELFTKPYEFSEVKISPKGTYISLISNENNIRKLIILDAKTHKPTYVARFPGDEEVRNYTWVNDERVVVEKQYNKGWLEESSYYGELFAVNANGKRLTYLFGYNSGEMSTGTRLKKNTPIRALGFIRHGLPDDKKYMLIKAYPIGNGVSGFMSRTLPQLYKVNVYTGKRKRIATSPITNGNFILDEEQQVRFAWGRNKNNDVEYFQLDDGDWKSVDNIKGKLNHFAIQSLAAEPDHVYAEGQLPGEKQALFKININTGEQTKLIDNNNVEPLKFWKDKNTNELYAVEFADGYPEYGFVDNQHPRAKNLKSLLKAIPGHQLHIVSQTVDDSQFIIKAFNDRNPGDYYLFNAEKNQLGKVISEASWIDPNDLADVKPISFTSRDGLTIHGYITLPYGIEHKNLPLVVNPHGGPIARDYWEYNSQAQLLAQQGIATLQVNFRGSSGYGLSFERAGYLNWGTKIQNDIIDATQYAIDQGWVNKDKICIEGGSFGGYSALQSAVVAPDLFKCAIGVAGVYDLTLMKEEGDIPSVNFGDAYLSEIIGDDENRHKAMSPAFNVDKLKAKILLVHGEKDRRTPIEQYESLEAALNKANYPFEKMIFEKEGHGLANPENQAEYYKKMVGFIKESLAL